MTNETQEMLRQLEVHLRQQREGLEKERTPTSLKQQEPCEEEILAGQLRLTVDFFHAQPYSETVKSCLQIKRSQIQARCTSKQLDFAVVEKLAECQMAEGATNFYRESIKPSTESL